MRFIFSILLLSFSVWMLHDAWQRRAPFRWYLVILFVPFGALIYFMFVKMQPRLSVAPVFGADRVAQTLDELERSATIQNRLAYAAALRNAGRHADALAEYETILTTHAVDHDALYGAGACAFALGNYPESIRRLEEVVQSHPSHDGFAAWLLLSEAHWAAGDTQTAVSVLDRLCRVSHLITHQITLARCYMELERRQEARSILEEALADFDLARPEVQRDSANDIRTVKRMLRHLDIQA